jgi:hypothetical protein
MMRRLHAAGRVAHRPIASRLPVVLSAVALLGLPRPAAARDAGAAAAAPKEGELPHSFFTPMGLAEGVGNLNLWSLGVAMRTDNLTRGDFPFHWETGLTGTIGLHLRNSHFPSAPFTEAMIQFPAVVIQDGMKGFAPIIEFEFPTGLGAGSRIQTLAGFTLTLGGSRAVFNQVW